MIAFYAQRGECWMAAGAGPFRPIVAEGMTRQEAISGFKDLLQNQLEQEYAMEQDLTALSLDKEEYK